MKKIFSFVFAAMMLLVSSSAMAQSETQKGDVNGDGVVDVADIAAIIKIMQEAGGAVEATKYYWYVGQSNPASNSTITTTTGEQGWRLITEIDKVSQSNPVFDTTVSSDERIVGSSKTYWFIALPKSLKIYDSDYVDQISAGNFTIESSSLLFNGVNYTVYKGVGTARNFDGYTIY